MLGFFCSGMGDQGVGGKCQYLIKNEQGEQVSGIGNSHD